MIRTAEAKQLCTKAELDVYTASLSRSIKKLSEKELKGGVTRSRRARDKYRSLAERQKRESRGKQGAKGKCVAKGSERTFRKADLFGQVLSRYETQIASVTGTGKQSPAASKTTAKSADKKKVTSKKKAAKKKSTAKKASKKKTAPKKAASKKKASGKTTEKKPPKKKPARKRKAVRAGSKSKSTTPSVKRSQVSTSTKKEFEIG